jgi:hypothetical protein
MAAIHGGNPDEALAILEREGHLMPERKIEAEAIAKKAKKPKVKIDHNRLMQMAMDDNCEGFCLACGAENFGIESDGGKGECEICGEHKVYGAARILGIV